MSPDQPDLLSWRPAPRPMAEIIPFPIARRVGKVRRVVDVLKAQTTERAQASYWNRECTTLEKQLARAGLSPDAIKAELEAFYQAVQGELNRRAYEGGGAA